MSDNQSKSLKLNDLIFGYPPAHLPWVPVTHSPVWCADAGPPLPEQSSGPPFQNLF